MLQQPRGNTIILYISLFRFYDKEKLEKTEYLEFFKFSELSKKIIEFSTLSTSLITTIFLYI